MSAAPTAPRGFTLLETLVAFVIAAAATAAVLSAIGSGLRTAAITAHTLSAWQRAQSRLTAQSVSLRAGDSSGDDGGGYAWQVSVRPLQSAGRLQLFRVAVTVSWRMDGTDRRVRLTSDRLLAAAE